MTEKNRALKEREMIDVARPVHGARTHDGPGNVGGLFLHDALGFELACAVVLDRAGWVLFALRRRRRRRTVGGSRRNHHETLNLGVLQAYGRQ